MKVFTQTSNQSSAGLTWEHGDVTLGRGTSKWIKAPYHSQIIQEESKYGKTLTYGAVHKENRKYSPPGRNTEDY